MYLQKDLGRQSIERDDDHVRFNSVSEMLGAGSHRNTIASSNQGASVSEKCEGALRKMKQENKQ